MSAIEFYEEAHGFIQADRVYYSKDEIVYRLQDLHQPETEVAILKAREMWKAACRKYMRKHGDRGSCVLGNGIYVLVKPPRARNVFRMRIASPLGQSESPGVMTKDPVLAYLAANGIDCWYHCGRID